MIYFKKQLYLPKAAFVEVTIVGDVNDGDYITNMVQYSEVEFIRVLPYLQVLVNHFGGSRIEQLHYCFQKQKGYGCQCEGYDYDQCEIRKRPDFIDNLDVSLIDKMVNIPSHEGYLCHNLESVLARFFDTDGKVYTIELK